METKKRLRIVHINRGFGTFGGATIAMVRLHEALIAAGHESIVCCTTTYGAVVPQTVQVKLPFFSVLWQICFKVFFKLIRVCHQSTGFIPTPKAHMVNALQPDAVICHWLQNDTLAIRELAQIKAPLFYYHHDLWPVRGLSAHEWFKVPRRLLWLDTLVKQYKRKIYKKLGNHITPVCASKWVAAEIERSHMFENLPRIIPLVLSDEFQTASAPHNTSFRILFGSRTGFGDGIKGGDRLLAALRLIPLDERKQMELVVFGNSRAEEEVEGLNIRFLGRLTGAPLVEAYQSSDLFVFPSRQETFGQTKIEALACGVPVVAFDETACAEGILHRVTGWVAPADDMASYAEGIRFFFAAWKRGQAVRVSAQETACYRRAAVVAQWEDIIHTTEERDER